LVTIRDMVHLQSEVLLQLGIEQPAFAVGGSMGGMQALEFGALEDPKRAAKAVISLCSNGRHQPWQIGISECQRQAVYADPLWLGGNYPPDKPPASGLGVARMMAMLTYRSQPGYWTKFARSIVKRESQKTFNVESYLHHQGKRFIERGFDAATYVTLTKAMDTHDIARGRGEYYEVLEGLKMPTLLVSISSDVLYPYSEQLELANHMPQAQHHMIQSDEGHDGFLLEGTKVATLVRGFLDLNARPSET